MDGARAARMTGRAARGRTARRGPAQPSPAPRPGALYRAGRPRRMRRHVLPPRSQRHSHGEGIAVRILEHAVAPPVRPLARGDENSEAALARATLGVLRIDPEDTDLGTEAALPGGAEARRPWHALVGVIRVQ